LDPTDDERPQNRPALSKFKQWAKSDVIAGGVLLGILSLFLGLLGNYSLLPCQSAIVGGKSCFSNVRAANPELTSTFTATPISTWTPVSPPIATFSPPIDLVWQQLSTAIENVERAPSSSAADAVQTLYVRAEGALRGPTSDEASHRMLLQKAEEVARTFDGSNKRLKALRDAAKAWRERKRFDAPDFGGAKRGITDFDKERLGEDGYRDDWDTLEEAEALLEWPKRGFTAATIGAVPAYLYMGNPDDLDGQIASRLEELLRHELHFTDQQHAALFIEIANATSYPERLQQAREKRRGRTTFEIKMHWIGGELWKPMYINEESSSTGGVDASSLDEAVQLNSRQKAIQSAHDKIIFLAR
jgi:hypothetical protein